jgi:uncharacterized protein YndB with AHSA1/START domain
MIDFTIETRIERPVADVFRYVTDPALLGTWQTNTVSAEVEGGGPLRLGSRLREVHRAPGGKQVPSLVEVTEWEPERRFALEVVEGTPVHAQMTFEPVGEATVFRFRAHGMLTGALRLAQPLLQIALRRQFRGSCAELKRVLEEA